MLDSRLADVELGAAMIRAEEFGTPFGARTCKQALRVRVDAGRGVRRSELALAFQGFGRRVRQRAAESLFISVVRLRLAPIGRVKRGTHRRNQRCRG